MGERLRVMLYYYWYLMHASVRHGRASIRFDSGASILIGGALQNVSNVLGYLSDALTPKYRADV